jgi:plasmid stabilization system protein ParE
MKVRYSETALRELDEIFAYIFERNRSAAAAIVDRVERLGALIGD